MHRQMVQVVGWFECPCHGSRYNAVGELERGPAPRGLDRFALREVAGEVEVDTSTTYLGPRQGRGPPTSRRRDPTVTEVSPCRLARRASERVGMDADGPVPTLVC